MFGMHIGSVLSGLGMRNMNTGLKMLSLLVFWVENGYMEGSKMGGVKNEGFFDGWRPWRGLL